MTSCGRHPRRRLRWALPAVLALACTAAAGQERDEYGVKARWLYGLAKFVEWPADAFENASSPIVIGIVGTDPFGERLDDVLRGRTLRGRGFKVERYETAKDIAKPHMLFVSSSMTDELEAIVKATSETSIVTVGDTEDFAAGGLMLNLVRSDKSFVPELNTDAAKRTKVKLDPKLISSARPVREKR